MSLRKISVQGNNGAVITWGQRARQRIDSTLIVERVQRCALGKEDMTQTELMAARMLLDRTLPMIQPIRVATEGGRDAKSITNDDLFKVIEGQAKRIA